MRPDSVKWFDWADEAFRKAQAEDKPIVLAIGAAWCHGCRVMDESTYGDPEVAELLNRDYVPVRVDSDRRPDINDRYNMGGWPSTAFLTPAGEILGGTTYVKPDQMKQLLVQLSVGYAREKHRLAEEIARREDKIARVRDRGYAGLSQLTQEIFRKTVRGIVATFDPIHAGFGNAPKFPMVTSLRVILQALHETGGEDFRQVLVRTLDAMGDRGMFDAVEGGFFHYVTNDIWTAPRFEKIGEDNGGLIRLYLDASLVTGEDKYRARATQALEWAKAKLLDPARGVFFGSQGADEEYYLVPPGERAKRPAPPVDPTVYVPASSVLASAFLRAAQVLGEEEFAGAALRGIDWLLRECVRPKDVAHYHDGKARFVGLARDRIALGGALLDAYEHSGREHYLEAAEGIIAPLAAKFWSDRERGIVDRLAGDGEWGELARPRRNIEENSQAAEALARLWRLGAGDPFREAAERILRGFPDFLDDYGHVTAEYALAADWLVRPATEIRIGLPGLRGAALEPYVSRRAVRHDASGRVAVVRGESRREAATAEEVRRALEEA